MDANAVVYGLKHANIIADGDLMMITRNPYSTQQNEILHACLKRSCDEEALMEVCDMMIAVQGNRKVNALGREMKNKLKKGTLVNYDIVCVYVCMCINWCVASVTFNVLVCIMFCQFYLCTVQVYACVCACVCIHVCFSLCACVHS